MRQLLLLLLPLIGLLSGCVDIPERTARDSVRPANTGVPVRTSDRQCLSELGAQKATFTPIPDRYFGTGCSTVNSITLASLRSDYHQLSVSNLGPVTCPMANTFAAWARYGVDRAARQILGSPLVRIETMGSYSCRNVAGTSRRSGHATANAIDVSGFVLADGRQVSVLRDWSAGSESEQRFLRIVHESACKRFGMVLGPQYNAAHRDHFHLEQKNGSFCR